MKIGNFFSVKTDFDSSSSVLNPDTKTKAEARKVIASIPTLGFLGIDFDRARKAIEEINWEGTVANVVKIYSFVKTAVGVINVFKTEQPNPFKMGVGREVYQHPEHWYSLRWTDSRADKWRVPPVFNSEVMRIYHILQQAPKDAFQKGQCLPHAIFFGPTGTGKTLACEVIARNAGVNYCILSEDEFITLAQDASRVTSFFKVLREGSVPTVLMIDNVLSIASKNRDVEASKAFEVFRANSGIDNKIMILCNTDMHKQDIDPKFLDRMNYQVRIDMPGPQELKEILAQHANKYPVLKELLDERTIAYLVDGSQTKPGIFLGRSGRDVKCTVMALDRMIRTLSNKPSTEEIYSFTKKYIDEHK